MPDTNESIPSFPIWHVDRKELQGPVAGPQLYDIKFIIGSLAVPGKVLDNVQSVITSDSNITEKLLTVERSYVAAIRHIREENDFVSGFEDHQKLEIAEGTGWREVASLAMSYLLTQDGYYPSPDFAEYLNAKAAQNNP